MATAIKKTFYHPKRNAEARKKFQEIIAKIPRDELVFIDESGIEDNACIEYGWSAKGTRCYGEKAYRHKRRVIPIPKNK